MWRDMGRYGEIRGDLGRYGEQREGEVAPHRVRVGVRVGAGEREQLPQLGFLGGERGVGDARLRQPEGHLVPAAEQADGEEVEGGGERA